MKQIYQLIGLIIIVGGVFFIGRLTVPVEKNYLKEFEQSNRELDSIVTLKNLTQDSLHNLMVLFNDEKDIGDDMDDTHAKEDKEKKSEYEKFIYPDMSNDESFNRAKSRLADRINR